MKILLIISMILLSASNLFAYGGMQTCNNHSNWLESNCVQGEDHSFCGYCKNFCETNTNAGGFCGVLCENDSSLSFCEQSTTTYGYTYIIEKSFSMPNCKHEPSFDEYWCHKPGNEGHLNANLAKCKANDKQIGSGYYVDEGGIHARLKLGRFNVSLFDDTPQPGFDNEYTITHYVVCFDY